MLKLFKKMLVFLIVFAVTVPSLIVFAQDPAARTLSVFRVDGEDAFLARSLGGRGVVPREGNRLSVGNVMTTGVETQVYMQLDAVSIVKMDEESEVAVAAAGNLLSLSVFRGSALVEVEQQAPEHTLETQIGNKAFVVRGTMFIAGIREEGEIVITMLSGEGVVYTADEVGAIVETPLAAGYVFWAHEAGVDQDFQIRALDLRVMSLFELQEIWNNREFLIQIGTITQDMLELLTQLIGLRQDERDARLEEQATAILAQNVLVPFVLSPFEEELVLEEPEEEEIEEVFDEIIAEVDDIIQFGGFDWRVLDVQGNQALIITENVITRRFFHHTQQQVTWQNSEIRSYLNNEFFSGFSLQDQARIATTNVINNANQWFGTSGGNNTTDRIFLLSIEEVVRYFGDSGQLNNRPGDMPVISDQFNAARIAHDLAGQASWWWLRSPGTIPVRYATFVYYDGFISLYGYDVHWEVIDVLPGGVRPALWLYLN